MNDDELVERLRSTLRASASAVDPSPGQLPVGRGTRRGGRGDHRPRWLPFAGALAVAAAAAIVVAVLVSTNSGHTRVETNPSGNPPSTGAPRPTTAPYSPTTVPSSVPADFRSVSTTWVSTDRGWALGLVPCGTESCVVLTQTTDGGITWTVAKSPTIRVTASDAAGGVPAGVDLEVRFADPSDGWIYNPQPADGAGAGSGITGGLIWSTHDGGATWVSVADPAGPDAMIEDLEASGGEAQLVTVTPGNGVEIYSTPVGRDSWSKAAVQPNLGGGPVPSAELVLSGTKGWVLVDNRTTVSGAILAPGAGWSAWTPPCADANGTGTMAAATPTLLFAVCDEGAWGTPAPGTTAGETWLYRSTDGGATWTAAGAVPDSNDSLSTPVSMAASPSGTVELATVNGLLAYVGGNAGWSPIRIAGGVRFIGFTTSAQAVAITDQGQLLLSHDGGQSW